MNLHTYLNDGGNCAEAFQPPRFLDRPRLNATDCGRLEPGPLSLQRNQSRPIPKPRHSSRRDHQEAATLHKFQQDTVTLVPL